MFTSFPGFHAGYYRHVLDVVKRSALVKNLFSVAGATIINNLIGLAVFGYSARVLGPEKYGITIYAASVAAYASIILSPGLGRWGIREISQSKDCAGKTLVLINSTQVILACVGFIGMFFYGYYYVEPKWFLIIILYGGSLFVTAINADWVCYGLELSRIVAWLSTLNSLISTVGLVAFIREPSHFYRMPLLAIIPPVIVQVVLYYFLIKMHKVSLQMPSINMYGVSVIKSIPLGLASVFTVIYTYANNFFIKSSLGTVSVGIYGVSFRIIQLAMAFMPILNVVIAPRIYRLVSEDINKAKRESMLYLKISMTVAFLITPIIYLHADQVINIIYGTDYAEAYKLLRIMCLAIIFQTAGYCYGGNLIVFKKDLVNLVGVFAIGVVSIIGGALLVPKIGMIGAAWSFLTINVLSFLIPLPWYRITLQTFGFSEWLVPIIGASAIMLMGKVLIDAAYGFWVCVAFELIAYIPFAVYSLRQVISDIIKRVP